MQQLTARDRSRRLAGYASGTLALHCLCIAAITQAARNAFWPALTWGEAVSVAASLFVLWVGSRLNFGAPLRLAWAVDLAASGLPLALIYLGDLREPFGLVYAAMWLCKVAALGITLAGLPMDGRKLSTRWVFVVSFLFYLAFTPWAAIDYTATGDEPHYMLLAESLVFDRDFDVRNNYESFIRNRGFIDMHGVTNQKGEVLLWHDVGTSVLIAPGYWIGERRGAIVVINIAAALLVAAIYRLALLLGAGPIPSLAAALLAASTAPFISYSSSIYAEMPGAACCGWAVVAFSTYVRTSAHRYLLLAGVLLAVQPWLSIRFWILVLAIGAVIALYLVRQSRWSSLAVLCAPMVISMALFAVLSYRYFGTWLPNAGYLAIRSDYPQFWSRPHISLTGMLLDRQYGLLPIAPFFVLPLAGMLRGLSRKWESAALLAPALAYLAFLSMSRHWDGGWCPPNRYILCSAALVAPFAALAISERRARPLVVLTTVWTLLFSCLHGGLPLNRFPVPSDRVIGGVYLFLFQKLGFEPSVLFPSLFREGLRDYLHSAAWFAIIGVGLWWFASEQTRRSRAMRVSFALTFLAVVSMVTGWLLLRPPERLYAQEIGSAVKQVRVGAAERFEIPVTLMNPGHRKWLHSGPKPVRLSYRWLSGKDMLPDESLRTFLPGPVGPEESFTLQMKVKAPPQPGDYRLRITLVEEGVAWFAAMSGDHLDLPARVDRLALGASVTSDSR